MILPTPVGLYLDVEAFGRDSTDSPHARGAVPDSLASVEPPRAFSPRPWGCTWEAPNWLPKSLILPTPVGLYRLDRGIRGSATHSPHARGAVPNGLL